MADRPASLARTDAAVAPLSRERMPREPGERILWVGDDARGGNGAEIVAVGSGPGADARTHGDALPFADGLFDAVLCTLDTQANEPRKGAWLVRELVRVVRPNGRIVLEPPATAGEPARRDLAAWLRAAGLDGQWQSGATAPRFAARRESGVTADTWRTLDAGAGATAWNDSMFEFQRTPYDRWMIAGQIFLHRIRWVASRVRDLRAERVLEVGCEAGGLLGRLPPGRAVVGLDLSLAALRTARRELAGRALSFVHADATRPLPFRDGEFDVVIASEVLEHCRSPRRIIGELHRVLAPTGRAILTIPNERRYLAWKEWLRRLPLARLALRGIEEGPAAWHIDHDFDRDKLLWLVDGFFTVERESSILGTTLAFVLRKT